MFAALSIESQIQGLTTQHKFSVASLAALDGNVSSPMLSKFLAGRAKLSSEKEQSVQETMRAIRKLIDDFPEVPIDLNQITRVKPLVDLRRIQLRDTEDPIVTQCYYIRLNSLTWLNRMRGNEPMPTYNYQVDGAAFESLALAEEAVRRLRIIHIASKWEKLTAERRASTIARSLEEIGFTSAVEEQSA